jgi:hypothetical protein
VGGCAPPRPLDFTVRQPRCAYCNPFAADGRFAPIVAALVLRSGSAMGDRRPTRPDRCAEQPMKPAARP